MEGSEQAGQRPAIILSPDLINHHSPVVIVASVTSKKTDRVHPSEVRIEAGQAGLKIRSKVLLMQIRSIDKRRIVGKYGKVGSSIMQEIEEALRIAVGLTPF
ncbi:MAG: type II toxin-antitoxin system PemK/MazF family toxin [Candidatus Hydrogenedentes bacterium]|nr:type II toxin-antitoxin system PemK/MazF family toxin [Candidatus Hydrogenedentota bacterium]